MIKETVQAVGVTHIVTESGSKTLLGNRQFEIGDSVWTHGNFAFGTERNSGIMILPTGMVPAEPGHFVVEFYYGDEIFKIRDVSNMQVVAEIPVAFGYLYPVSFCYDDNLTFYAVSKGPSEQSSKGVTIHTIQNGVYTTEWVNLPNNGYFKNITCRVVNHQFTWTAFVNDFKYIKKTNFDGTPYTDTGGTIAFYDYIGTELQNTYDYTSRVNAACDEAWNTLNDNYNTPDLVTCSKANAQVVETSWGYAQNAASFSYNVVRDIGGMWGSTFRYYSNDGRQFPQMTTPRCYLVCFEKKLIEINLEARCHLYVAGSVASGTFPNNNLSFEEYVRFYAYEVGVLRSARRLVMDTEYSHSILLEDKINFTGMSVENGQNYLVYSTITPPRKIGVYWGTPTPIYRDYYESGNITITYNGPNTSTENTYNDTWQQPLDYGYYIDVGLTSFYNEYPGYTQYGFDYTAELNDGNGWTFDVGSEFGYHPQYPDFMAVDQNADIIYYTGSTDELYKIDKATKALTLIHDDALYSQMQMSVIEKSQDEIVSALTTT